MIIIRMIIVKVTKDKKIKIDNKYKGKKQNKVVKLKNIKRNKRIQMDKKRVVIY